MRACASLIVYDTASAVQGSPLVPDDLRMVSASSAAATVIVSDSSRSGQLSALSHDRLLLRQPPITNTLNVSQAHGSHSGAVFSWASGSKPIALECCHDIVATCHSLSGCSCMGVMQLHSVSQHAVRSEVNVATACDDYLHLGYTALLISRAALSEHVHSHAPSSSDILMTLQSMLYKCRYHQV